MKTKFFTKFLALVVAGIFSIYRVNAQTSQTMTVSDDDLVIVPKNIPKAVVQGLDPNVFGESLIWDDGSGVGIGISNPAGYKLNVNGTTSASGINNNNYWITNAGAISGATLITTASLTVTSN